ncbi:hypothetical protein ACEPAF_4905 [Sanghuangporus sanghuang]
MPSSVSWDPTRAKAQIRLAAQRLGQLQDRKDSLAHITSKDIATLLGHRNVSLARTKAQNLMNEDAVSNAMEVLEMYCALVLERFSELEKDELELNPSMVEAVATIIYAAPFTECQELLIVRGVLMDRLGPDFSQSALYNSDGHVSQRIIRLMHAPPSADDIDAYLFNIARKFGVDWKPRMKIEQKLVILSEMLDASDIMGTVDLMKLREIASSGIPVNPSWLRARVWKLLLGITPLTKAQWESESRKKREGYYELIRHLLVNIVELPPPSTPLSPPDKSLLALVESLSRVPAHLFRGLEDEIEQSATCPLHESASPDIKIGCASALEERLQLVQDQSPKDDDDESFSSTPEIRLDSGSTPTSPQEASFSLSEAAQGTPQQPKTLSISSALSPKVFRSVPTHPFHISALLRLLYIHRSLNPGSESPHLASLLVPLYTVMNQEAEPAEAAHAEADTFWLFEVLIREVSELDETEGGLIWMKKFRERASMADHELLEDLTFKGLDPGLPQYSYRWLAPVLSHTLPLPAVLMAWDAIFAQAEMTRQSNPRLEHLLDICTAMLVRARAQLLLLGKGGRKSPSLWDVEPSGVARQTLRPWELGDAFMEGMTLLQNYPVENAGGMERILQVAGDILIQREQLTKPPQNRNPGLGAMIRDKVWRGITNQSAVEVENNSPEDSDEETEDETETENENERARSNTITQSSANNSGWGSYLKATVIRGITNESAMDPESPRTSPLPSPTRPSHDLSPAALSSPLPEEKPSSLAVPNAGSGLWGYAEKLRQSDMAAKLAKASTNLSAKALDAWTSRNAVAHGASTSEKQQAAINPETSLPRLGNGRNGIRHGSMPNIHHPEPYSPPPRPAFFKPPRDTRVFSSDEINSLKIPDSPESGNSSLSASTLSAEGHTRADSLASVLPSWASGQSRSPSKSPKPTKSAPKPLLLSASSLVTAGSVGHVSRSVNSTPIPRNLDWSDVRSSKVLPSSRRQDSEFSETSVSPRTSNHSTSPKTALSGWDSDQSVSRVVRLNRQSISPMAPAFRINRSSSRNPSVSSQSEFGVLHYKTASEYRSASEGSPRVTNDRIPEDETRGTRSWDRISPDSPSTLPSSPPPRTPVTNSGLMQSSVRVANAERQRGSLVLSESRFSGLDAPPQGKRAPRKPSSPTVVTAGDTSDSSIPSASLLGRNTPRVRTKRLNLTKVRPPSLRTRSPEGRGASISMPGQSPSSLAAPDLDSELDMATTPRAQQFPSTSPTDAQSPRSPRWRKISMEGPERRRKLSGETNGTRTRKISTESRSTRTRKISDSRRDSHANDGDDEGYDELLSAYESEASNSKYESAASSEA